MKKYLLALPVVLCAFSAQAYDQAHVEAVRDALIARDGSKGFKKNQVVTVTSADLSNADFSDIIASKGNKLTEIRKVVFIDCNLTGTQFSGGNKISVTDVTIENSVADDSSFHYGLVSGLTVGKNTSFHNADLRSIRFSGENVFDGIYGDNVSISGSSIHNVGDKASSVKINGTDAVPAEGKENLDSTHDAMFNDPALDEAAAYKPVELATLDFTKFKVDTAAKK